VAAWNGTTWSAVPAGAGASNGLANNVQAMCLHGGSLIVGGVFTALGSGTTANRVAAYNGTTWTAVGTGLGGSVNALASFGGKLYAGGAFTTLFGGAANSANRIAVWDGSSWGAIGPAGAFNGLGGVVMALAVNGGVLHIGGAFTALGDTTTIANRMAAWDGTSFSSITLGVFGNGVAGGQISAMQVYKNATYVGGGFTTLGNGVTPARYVAYI
jgi:hypothetical protein